MAWNDNLTPGTPAHAIASSRSTRIRVLAGPGTGKSFAMKRRVARLLEVESVSPASILPVTFTRVAAEDLHRELATLGVVGLHGRTLHSLAMSILMRNHVLAALGRTPRPLNKFELAPLEQDLGVHHGNVYARRRLIKAYGAAWARLQTDDPGYTRSAAEQRFERELISWLRFHKAMLIEEVIPHLYKYLKDNPGAPERGEFSHVLVDEYQDLNRAEQDTLHLLGEAGALCVIGDDDQSIYSFKHAHPQGIRDWSTHHSASDHGIDECFRCPTRVVRMANTLIAKNVDRVVGRLMLEVASNGEGQVVVRQYDTIAKEAAAVAEKIKKLVASGVHPRDIIVLAQREILAAPMFAAIQETGVPVKSYYAEAALNTMAAQERFALLELLSNRMDRVALRWLLGRGHTKWHTEQYRRVMEHALSVSEEPRDLLEKVVDGTLTIPRTKQLTTRYQSIAEEMRALEAESDLDRFIALWLPDDTDTALLAQVVADCREGISTKEELREKLQEAIARPDVPVDVEEVRVMSLHKSKGLSAPFVFIVGCVEGLLPSEPKEGLSAVEAEAKLEEDRRLFYVGITRVKAKPPERTGYLALTYARTLESAKAHAQRITPARRARGVAYLQASRFLSEMAPHLPAAEANRPL